MSRLVPILCVCLAFVAPARAADLDPHLPPDTASYVSVNVRKIVDSEFFKDNVLDFARDGLKELPGANDILSDLGLDPFKDLDRVIVAGPGGAEADRGLIILHGRFDEAKFKKKGEDAARDNADNLKLHKVAVGAKAHTIYEVVLPGQDASIFVAVVDAKTMLVSPGKDYVSDALKAAPARKKGELKNKELQALVERLDPKLAVAVAIPGKTVAKALAAADAVPKGVAEAFDDVEAVGGGVLVTNEVRLDVVVAGKTEAAAGSVRDGIDKGVKLALVGLALLGGDNKELAALLDVVKSVKVGGKGKVVSVTGTLSADVLKDLLKKDG